MHPSIASRLFDVVAFLAIAFCAISTDAALVGTNVPAALLTPDRIAALAEPERRQWIDYLDRSQRQRRADQEFIRGEIRRHNVHTVTAPKEARTKAWMSLDRSETWYAQAETRRVANAIITFQTPAGGWSKNIDMSQPREPGMLFGIANASRFPSAAAADIPESSWSYVGTIDNDATTMQLKFLARVIAGYGTNSVQAEPLKQAFLRGLNYIINAQYPNGGWPQVWPLQGGYHDAVTFNDNAIVNVLDVLWKSGQGTNEYSFVPPSYRKRTSAAFANGLECVLKAQVVANGRLTVWPQQSDALTLRPTSARNFEMASLASAESANLMRFLMKLPNPEPGVIRSVHAAAAWFSRTALSDVAYRAVNDRGRVLVPAPGAGPLWARYYDVGSEKPVFGDRDMTIHDSVDAISEERRVGYAWFGDSPEEALKAYAKWSARYPR